MTGRSFTCAGLIAAIVLALPAHASAGEEILGKASYADATTYSCGTAAIEINPGQNLNNFILGQYTTCPDAVNLDNPGEPTPFTTNA